MKLTGKVALVTGASRGIGRGIAIELAKEGASVAVNFSKDEKGAYETLDIIKKLGGYGIIVRGDVSLYSSSKELIEEVINTFGKLDILVNNAGISKLGLFVDMTAEDFDKVVDVNLKGVFNCTHNALPHMLKRRSGNIINVSSIWGNVGASCEVLYSASKGGINIFTRALAKEMAPSNIRVNAIAPGVIDTDMNNWMSKEEREQLEEEIPMNRFGSIEEVGKLAAFLASSGSEYLTGQVITLDGGML